eukprot:1459853-Pleurochrysis_carterae.AAC.1
MAAMSVVGRRTQSTTVTEEQQAALKTYHNRKCTRLERDAAQKKSTVAPSEDALGKSHMMTLRRRNCT